MNNIHAASNIAINNYQDKKKKVKPLGPRIIKNHLESFWKKYGVNNQFMIMDLNKLDNLSKLILTTSGNVEDAERAYSDSIEMFRVKS